MWKVPGTSMGITRILQVSGNHQYRYHDRRLYHLFVGILCAPKRGYFVSPPFLSTLCIIFKGNVRWKLTGEVGGLGQFFSIFERLCRFDTQAYGLTCVISGFLIGFKQLVPDHSVTLWKVVSVRVKVDYSLPSSCIGSY